MVETMLRSFSMGILMCYLASIQRPSKTSLCSIDKVMRVSNRYASLVMTVVLHCIVCVVTVVVVVAQ